MSKPILCLDRYALAWAAGFFDGEGTVLARKRTAKRYELSLSVAQAEKTTLERFSSAVGELGIVRGPYKTQLKGVEKKPIFIFYAYGFEEVQAIIGFLWLFLSMPKRFQAKQAIEKVIPYEIERLQKKDRCKRGHWLRGEEAETRRQLIHRGSLHYMVTVCKKCERLRKPSKEHLREYARMWRKRKREAFLNEKTSIST